MIEANEQLMKFNIRFMKKEKQKQESDHSIDGSDQNMMSESEYSFTEVLNPLELRNKQD